MTLSGNRDAVDRYWGIGLGAIVAVFAFICSSGEPPPGLWENLAIAAGARPAAVITDTLWMAIASALVRYLPGGIGYWLLRAAGPIALGFMGYVFAGALQMMLPSFLRVQLAEKKSRVLIRRFVILPVAFMFCFSEPIWRIGLYFTPDTLRVTMALGALYGLMRFLRNRLRVDIIVSFLLMGLVCAEEPLGFAFLFAAASVMFWDLLAMRNSGSPLVNTYTTLYAFLHRMLTILTLVMFCASVAFAWWFFLDNAGLEASGGDGQHAMLEFFLDYFRKVPAIATLGGWVYFVGIGLLPLAIGVVQLKKAMNVEKILSYRMALCYIITGVISFLQLANFPMFWYWQSNAGRDAVSSPMLLAVTMFCESLSLAISLSVLLVEVFFRHYDRYSELLFHDAPKEFVDMMEKFLPSYLFKTTWNVIIFVPYLLLLLSTGWRPNLTERGMRLAVGDFVRLVADDCEGSPLAITDGSVDAGLELEVFRRGRKDFKALSIMGERTAREKYLRRRGEAKDSEDWTALGISAAAALRDWVRMKGDRSTNLTVQIGFEMWRHEKLPMPSMGATAGRTDGFAPEVRSNLVERAHALGERMLKLAEKGAPNVTSDSQLRRMWNFTLWRLARAARMRSDEADLAKDVSLAREETDFADRLDDANLAYQEVRRRTEWVPRQINARFTPREGLRFALQQADFSLASTYARQILAKNENDFHANFAMGMYYVTAEQYTRAMQHLDLAHRARPKDPSALNNLAVVEMHIGRLDRALEHAEEAQSLMKDSPEIKRTVQEIRHQMEKEVKAKKAEEENL